MVHRSGLKGCLLLCSTSRPSTSIFICFHLDGPHTQVRSQYTWTVLPQGFQNSPDLFGQVLTGDFSLPGATILQYVDDFLICSPAKESSNQHTITTLNFVAERVYQVSAPKAPISQQQVTYLRNQASGLWEKAA